MLTHAPAKVGVGQSPEPLVLVGTDDRRPSNGVTGCAIPSAHGWVQVMTPRRLKHRFRGLYPSKEVRRVAVGDYTP